MKNMLVALNSKFVHTSLALRYICSYCRAHGTDVTSAEFTINSDIGQVAEAILNERPDICGFSCYVFNIEKTLAVIRILKKVRPDCVVFVGGPEVSFECESFLRSNPEVDFIVRGEGEETDCELISCLNDGRDPKCVAGISYIYEDNYVCTADKTPICDLSDIPFPYSESELDTLKDRILYYESSRGCPFLCTYCMSSLEKSVRTFPLSRVYEDLCKFISHNVRQVKFVDRTFNFDRARALDIMKFIAGHDNGVTNFHFEMSARLLDDETVSFIRGVRPGLFRLEIGIQSTNPNTQHAIRRDDKFVDIKEKISSVIGYGTHIHADLIAGLPLEDYKSFTKSFDDVMSLCADCVQLGFLKVLRGAPVYYQKEHGIVFDSEPPYEILYNKYITYDEIRRLKKIEALLDLYYNSGLCRGAIDTFTKKLGHGSFAFWDGFVSYLVPDGFFDVAHSPDALFRYLFGYAVSLFEDKNFCGNILAYDLYGSGKISAIPEWVGTAVPDRSATVEILRDADTVKSILSNNDYTIFSAVSADKWFRRADVVAFDFSPDGVKQRCRKLFLYGEIKKSFFLDFFYKNLLTKEK